MSNEWQIEMTKDQSSMTIVRCDVDPCTKGCTNAK